MTEQDSAARTEAGMATRPLTGDEYIESLRDGREIWIYGDRVEDVTTHPAFRNAVRMTARLYDSLHDPEKQNVLTAPTDAGGGGFTHKFFRTPRSVEDMVARPRRHRRVGPPDVWAGWVAAPTTRPRSWALWAPTPTSTTPTGERAALVPRGAGARATSEPRASSTHRSTATGRRTRCEDVFMHVVEETDPALVVSGAKVVATGSAITHYNFISHHGLPIKAREFALICVIPMDAQGMKLICRPSYSMTADLMGSPFDYPLSSRFDENDTIFILDRRADPVGELVRLRRRSTRPTPSSPNGLHPSLHSSTAAHGLR